jgi:hypothetical protein
MLAELPGQQPVALAVAFHHVGKRHRFFGWKGFAERLDEDFDLAATCQTDVERHLVADAVRNQAGVIFVQHLLGVLDHVVLDAPARDGADELAVFGDGHLGPRPPRSRAIRLHHRGHSHLLAGLAPALNIWKKFFHGIWELGAGIWGPFAPAWP